MHTLMAMGGGCVLLGLCVLYGNLWGADVLGAAWGARIFIPIWFVMAVANMWVGVVSAGYPLREEAPVFLLVFGVPALAAGLIVWWLTR